MSHINDEMAAAIGRQISKRVSFPVSASDIRRWAIAVYWPEEPPRLFWDEEYAATTPHRGLVAPEEFNPFAWMAASVERLAGSDGGPGGPDRVERALGITAPELPFELNGGMEVDYGPRIRPGDVVSSVSRLANYSEREGRLGLMLFTTMEDTWTNGSGEVVKRTRSTQIRYGGQA